MSRTSHSALAALVVASVAASGLLHGERYEASEPHMGSVATITLYAEDSDQARRGFVAAFRRIAELNRILSDYDPESELSRACQTNTRASADLLAVVQKAQRLAQETGGAFDITAGPLVRLWRQARKAKALPDERQIEEARKRVGYEKLAIRDGAIHCASPDMQLDAGGIAKGYAADQALLELQKTGIKSALVAMSGDIAAGDPPPGRDGWKVRVQGETRMLSNSAVSTSGDAFQFAVIGGKRYSHIVDPRTGRALEDSRTVAVSARHAINADAIATAVSVDSGKEVVAKLAAVFHAEIVIKY